MARNLVEALKTLDKAQKIYSYVTKPAFYLLVLTGVSAIFTSGTLGTAFTFAAAVTGICMLVRIVTTICLNIYAVDSCNSKLDNPNTEQHQAVSSPAIN